MGIATVQYVDALGTTHDLNDGAERVVRDLTGTGVPPVNHQVVRVPNVDGATYVDSLLDERFVIVDLRLLAGGSWATLQTRRRELVAAVNPRLGMGTLKYQPEAGSPVYQIPAILESGAGLDSRNGHIDRCALSFRCPDPAWVLATPDSDTLNVPAGGWSIPWSIPWSFSEPSVTETLNNQGDLASFPTVTITAGAAGCTNPAIQNVTTGKTLSFSGLTLAAAEVAVVDMAAKTAVLDADDSSIFGYIAEGASMWSLAPGNNSVKGSVATGSATMLVAWSRRYVGV